MAVSTKKTTHARQGKRRSHHAIKGLSVAYCSNCSAAVRSHCICPSCGFYKGKQVVSK